MHPVQKTWTRPGLKRLKVGNCARSAPIQKERQNLSLFSLYTVHTEIQVRIVQNSPKSGKNFHESFQKSTFGELWVVSWFKINPKLLQAIFTNKILTHSRHWTLQIFEFQFSKSLFLLLKGDKKTFFYWSKKYFRPIKKCFLVPLQ